MDNFTIYKKTLGFSIRRIIWDLLSILILLSLMTIGFVIAENVSSDAGMIGLIIGGGIGLIILIILLRFVSYTLKAGQIAMMTKGVTEGTLPDDVIGEGKKIVKQRFVTVAAYFAITNAIKGIFNQLSNAITKLGEKVGGNTGNAVSSAISSAISVLVSYLCDCCLGWVFYRSEVKAAKATCEGAVLFFRHGKTLAKNVGRIFGMGLASLLIIGGVFTAIFYAILAANNVALSGLYVEISQALVDSEDKIAQLLQNPATIPIVIAAIGGIFVWSMIHSTLIQPFVLTGVLRNYMESGMNEVPSEASFGQLDSYSPKFRKLHNEL